ncbi:type I restriction-modification system subunit M [Listeria seeligeri]|uniref:type I restriction-modification system subunit M n=1 Tax=Listeria seeligeri TaxID=1640 RepID=UPI0001C4E883|nr:type I restriction-modification system subunit M [Listeria seeligeri]CBH27916.1 type I restriction-modification system, M subunit [Listeria seeligeri serovar 1/2b str. SLCC3954]
MAIKKSEIYNQLWAAADKLRGGVEPARYKNYILTMLFVKYVSDKYKTSDDWEIEIPADSSFDDIVKHKFQTDIGEKINTSISAIAEKNNLKGIIDIADFDSNELGEGKTHVDKVSDLVAIFQKPELDFTKNRAGGDDILGDAYEYLMRKFAQDSGKSKGQFYTPGEVSRVMARVIGLDKATSSSMTVYDPACGSGSLLIRAADVALVEITIYGQEYDPSTAGLARMNLVLHNKGAGEIQRGNTLADPKWKENNQLKRFDYIVVNPPFSDKSWTDGTLPDQYGRYSEVGYGVPPEKNGDYAWFLHVLKSLKAKGKAAIILPHGVLFRGNTEGEIRKKIIDHGYIKGIIGLPANIFFGTGIPACIIIVDKEDAVEREGIFMIDASQDFVKEGNKNRLREQDIEKIVRTFNTMDQSDTKYARFVLNEEIKEDNEYNLSIPRYIDNSNNEDLQDIEAHLKGGIPESDVDLLSNYWEEYPSLHQDLFEPLRLGYLQAKVEKEQVVEVINANNEFIEHSKRIKDSFLTWKHEVLPILMNLTVEDKPKNIIEFISHKILRLFEEDSLIKEYDVYQIVMEYWEEIMEDDIYAVISDGYEAGNQVVNITRVKKANGEEEEEVIGWEGLIIPKEQIIITYFEDRLSEIQDLKQVLEKNEAEIEELRKNHNNEDSSLFEFIQDGKFNKKMVSIRINEIKSDYTNDEISVLKILWNHLDKKMKKKDYLEFLEKNPLAKSALTEKGTVTKTSVLTRIKKIRDYADIDGLFKEEFELLTDVQNLLDTKEQVAKKIKEKELVLDLMTKEKYSELSIEEIKELLEEKWFAAVYGALNNIHSDVSHQLSVRVKNLVERYESKLSELAHEVVLYEEKVKHHLERMGFEW